MKTPKPSTPNAQASLDRHMCLQQGDELIEVSIPAIFTQEEWDQIQGVYQRQATSTMEEPAIPPSGRSWHHLYCQCVATCSE